MATKLASKKVETAEAAEPARQDNITVLAIGLWVLVGSLLAYGIFQTAIKAAQLFA